MDALLKGYIEMKFTLTTKYRQKHDLLVSNKRAVTSEAGIIPLLQINGRYNDLAN